MMQLLQKLQSLQEAQETPSFNTRRAKSYYSSFQRVVITAAALCN